MPPDLQPHKKKKTQWPNQTKPEDKFLLWSKNTKAFSSGLPTRTVRLAGTQKVGQAKNADQNRAKALIVPPLN